MIWQLRKYHLWVINTAAEAQLYLWHNWKDLLPQVNTLVALSPEKAFIRTHQIQEHKPGFLGFGRMVWNQANNEKWSRKYREGEYAQVGVTFLDTEIWAPDWLQCDNMGTTPDLYIQLYHHPKTIKPHIKEGLIIAIEKGIVKHNRDMIDTTLRSLMQSIPNAALAHTTRSWGAGSGHLNQIQDINNWELDSMLQTNAVTPN